MDFPKGTGVWYTGFILNSKENLTVKVTVK
jgi:hypothetical protein